MWNNGSRENNNGEGVVAVAVDKEKRSQQALKWAVENLFPRREPLKLIHVVQRSPSPNPGNNSDNNVPQEAMEVLPKYRCFCTRKQVPFEVVTLYDTDVARALIDYASLGGIDKLLLGSLSRNGLHRIFKNSDVSSNVLKWASNYCTVYIISKGKVSAMRHASRSAQANHAVERTQPIYHIGNNQANPDIRLYDELSVMENDTSVLSSGRLSTDSNCFSFYENLESGTVGSSSDILNLLDNANFETLFSSPKVSNMDTVKDFPCNEGPSGSLDAIEGELRRHKIELNNAMDLYHAACREAKASKQKLMELEDWKMKQEQKIKEVEMESAIFKAEIESEKRLAQKEMENKVLKAEIKAMMEADEKQKVLDALSQSNSLIKYQILFHTFIVLLLSYICYSSIK